MAIFFSFPARLRLALVLGGWKARVIACIMMFLALGGFSSGSSATPPFGPAKFAPEFIPWHVHWLWLAPTDYWTMSVAGMALMVLVLPGARTSFTAPGSDTPVPIEWWFKSGQDVCAPPITPAFSAPSDRTAVRRQSWPLSSPR